MSVLHVAAAISLQDGLKLDSVLFILSQTFSSFNTLNFLFLVQVCVWELSRDHFPLGYRCKVEKFAGYQKSLSPLLSPSCEI